MTTKHAYTGTKIPETASQFGPGSWMPQVASQPDFNPFANIEAPARSPGATLSMGANPPMIRQPAIDTAPLQGMHDLSDPDSLMDVIAASTAGGTRPSTTTATGTTVTPRAAAIGEPHKPGAKAGSRASCDGECSVTAVGESSAPLVCFAAPAGEVTVDAAVLAEALGVAPAELLQRIRTRQISAIHEHGVGDDAGREQLIFYHRNRRVRLLIDAQGAILERVVERVHR